MAYSGLDLLRSKAVDRIVFLKTAGSGKVLGVEVPLRHLRSNRYQIPTLTPVMKGKSSNLL